MTSEEFIIHLFKAISKKKAIGNLNIKSSKITGAITDYEIIFINKDSKQNSYYRLYINTDAKQKNDNRPLSLHYKLYIHNLLPNYGNIFNSRINKIYLEKKHKMDANNYELFSRCIIHALANGKGITQELNQMNFNVLDPIVFNKTTEFEQNINIHINKIIEYMFDFFAIKEDYLKLYPNNSRTKQRKQ